MKNSLVCLLTCGLLSSSLFGSVSASNVGKLNKVTAVDICVSNGQDKPGNNGFLYLGHNNDEQRDSKVQEENNEDSKNKASFAKKVLKGGRKLLQITAYSTGAMFIATRKKTWDLFDKVHDKLKDKVSSEMATIIALGTAAGVGLSGLVLAASL